MAQKDTTIKNELKRPEKLRAPKAEKKPKTPGNNPKASRIIGLVLVSFSAFLVLSLISFLFTWQTDQSLVNTLDWKKLSEANPQMTDNWMGIFGAWMSHLL